jgi:hypothetical protein
LLAPAWFVVYWVVWEQVPPLLEAMAGKHRVDYHRPPDGAAGLRHVHVVQESGRVPRSLLCGFTALSVIYLLIALSGLFDRAWLLFEAHLRAMHWLALAAA